MDSISREYEWSAKATENVYMALHRHFSANTEILDLDGYKEVATSYITKLASRIVDKLPIEDLHDYPARAFPDDKPKQIKYMKLLEDVF